MMARGRGAQEHVEQSLVAAGTTVTSVDWRAGSAGWGASCRPTPTRFSSNLVAPLTPRGGVLRCGYIGEEVLICTKMLAVAGYSPA